MLKRAVRGGGFVSESEGKKLPQPIDFVCKIVNYDERRGSFDFVLKPDPHKYQWVEIGGERHLKLTDDGSVFSEEEVQQFAQRVVDSQMSFHSPAAGRDFRLAEHDPGNGSKWFREMASAMAASQLGPEHGRDYLRGLGVDELDFVILSIDIARSTHLATSLGREQYKHLIIVALGEIGAPIPEFGGQILKYTGDGLIAYFPESRHAMENDQVVECALAIREVVAGDLNDFLESGGFPRIDVRIGIDSGMASIVTLGTPDTREEIDLIGATVSLASKVQRLALPSSVLIGEMAYQRLQPQWQARCKQVDLPGNWLYANQDGEQYRVYEIDLRDVRRTGN